MIIYLTICPLKDISVVSSFRVRINGYESGKSIDYVQVFIFFFFAINLRIQVVVA